MLLNISHSLLRFIKHSLLLLICLNMAAGAAESTVNYDGIWRGELVIQKDIVLPIGIVISEDNTKLTIDSPNQDMFDHVPTTFDILGNDLSFADDGLKAKFQGKLDGNMIEGVFTQGHARPLVLHKLDKTDIERMKFEGKYEGDLVINSSSQLPLVVNIAVIKDGFSAALDSPAQNSFGIPINSIDINDTKLSFSSKMIKASFSGTKEDNSYKGTFVQGMPLPLSLSKVTAKAEQTTFIRPSFGEKGGSIAVITQQGIDKRYFGEHAANTLYEIGSISKTFTAYLLAHQIIADQASLSTRLEHIFSNSVSVSFKDLAIHMSGMQRNPPNIMKNINLSDPFSNLDLSALKTDLKNTTLGDKKYLYSNFAYAALGEALAANVNSTFSAQVQDNVLSPLNMKNSYIATNRNDDRSNIAKGHAISGNTASLWHFAAAAGAGAIVSSLDDMIKYAQHMMTLRTQNESLAQTLLSPLTIISECCEQALAWILMEDKQGKKYAWHNGMTGGFSSFLGFYLDGSKAVVLLNNQATSIDELGHSLLTDDSLNISNI